MMKHLLIFLIVASSLLVAACGSDPLSSVEGKPAYSPLSTVTAELTELPRLHEAVGTVKARTDIRVEAQVTGRVAQVLVRPGDKVKEGDKMIVLDSAASQTRVDRAKQAALTAVSLTAQARDVLNAAQAQFSKSESTYRRMKQLADQKVVTAEEVEQAENAYLQAQASLGQAKEGLAAAKAREGEAAKAVQEAAIGLGYTTILAPADGEVAQRQAEPGDLAFPGKELLTLQTGGSLRMEAMVRESLIGQVHIGDTLEVIVSALEGTGAMLGTVDEIEPLADPVTRSFLVKARLPEMGGLYPGMFGRLLIPLGKREVVLAPRVAVRTVGQLETVMVKSGDNWENVYVRTGAPYGDKVEILSGLSGGETLGIGLSAEAAQ